MRSHTLQIRRHVAGSEDAHGNAARTHGAPEDWIVWGLAPGVMQELNTPNRDASDIAWTVLAPADDNRPDYRDLVIVDGDEYAIEGRPKDYTRGPWPAPFAGIAVELKRTEG